MGLFSKFKKQKLSTKSANTLDIVADLTSTNTVNVNARTALKCVPYRSAINIITESIGVLSAAIYKKRPNSIRQKEPNHPLSKLITKPNAFQTSQDFFKTIVFNLLHHNEAFVRVVRAGTRVVELIPLATDEVSVDVHNDFSVTYRFRGIEVDPNDILRFKGTTSDGLTVEPTWKQARQPIELYLSLEQYSKQFFESGARASGIFMIDQVITREGVFNDLAKTLQKALSRHGIPLVEGINKYQKLDSSLRESQVTELKQKQVIEIARIFNLPAHLIQSYEGTSYNSIEALGIEFQSFTMMPIVRTIESTINTFLINEPDIYLEFEWNTLMRADTASKFEAYQKQILNGIRSVNEIRELENLEPIENGDFHLYPLNNAFIETAKETNSEPQADIDNENNK